MTSVATSVLRELFQASTAVTDEVGTRIGPWIAPERVTLPHVTLSPLDAPEWGHMSGASGYRTFEIQADVWAETFSQANTIAEALRKAGQRIQGVTVGTTTYATKSRMRTERGGYERRDDSGSLYRVIQEWVVGIRQDAVAFVQ